MSYAIEKTTVEQAISGASSISSIKTVYDNVRYEGEDSEWIRVTLLPAKADQISLGPSPYFRYWGVLVFQIFVKPNIGAGRAIAIADLISPIFRAQKIGTITFRTPTLKVIGDDSKAEWFQVNLSVNFFREE